MPDTSGQPDLGGPGWQIPDPSHGAHSQPEPMAGKAYQRFVQIPAPRPGAPRGQPRRIRATFRPVSAGFRPTGLPGPFPGRATQYPSWSRGPARRTGNIETRTSVRHHAAFRPLRSARPDSARRTSCAWVVCADCPDRNGVADIGSIAPLERALAHHALRYGDPSLGDACDRVWPWPRHPARRRRNPPWARRC